MDQPTTEVTSLPPILTDRLVEIAAICRKYGVRQLYVFGSAVHGTFDPDTSDLDFMVDLGEYEPTIALRYSRFYSALHDLFERDIDLITARSSGSDRFLRAVIASRELIYAA